MAPAMDRAERQYKPGERVPGTEYVVVRLEAEGGHGALYLVRHHFLEKKVQMLKTLRSIEPSTDLVERLKREAQMLAAMDHPHIVSVTSGGLTDEKQPKPYFVMERLKGRSLAQILPEAPEGVGIDAALKVTIELCDALEYVHVRHGVVHRDIKPDNVFLHITPRNGSITKILDFGVAHIMDLEQRYTKNNLFLGTPRYASPEQILGDKPTPQTDLYAVGLVLYELLLGHGPFDDANTFASVATAHCQRDPPGFPKTRLFPTGLEALVLSLLRKKAADRPKSAEWLATQLRQIKRIAELAEQTGGDVNQTEMSPMQNILTGHRAQLTEAGAPLDLASEPAVSSSGNETLDANPTTQQSPLAYGSTVAVESPSAGAPPGPMAAFAETTSGGPVDRAAATRSLHVEVTPVPVRSHGTERLLVVTAPASAQGRPGALDTVGPSSRRAPAALSTTTEPRPLPARRPLWGAFAGALAGVVTLALVAAGIGKLVTRGREMTAFPGGGTSGEPAPLPPAAAPSTAPVDTAAASSPSTASTEPASSVPSHSASTLPAATHRSTTERKPAAATPARRLPSSGLDGG